MTEEKTTQDQPTESPTLPEGQQEETGEISAEEQAKAVLEELKSFGVETPEQVQGMAVASKQAGNLAQQLGTARKEVEQLMQEVNVLRQQPKPESYGEEFGEPTTTLNEFAKKDDIKAIIRDFYREEIVAPQQQVQEQYMQDVAYIKGHKLYSILGNKFEELVKSPDAQLMLGSGAKTLKGLYNEFAETYLYESLKKTKGALEAVTTKGLAPPHLESGQTQSVPLPTQDEERIKRIKQKTSREVWEGSSEQLTDLVRELLPDDDPLIKTA